MPDTATQPLAVSAPISKEVIFERDGVKAVRLKIAAGHGVPAHSASVDVFAAVIRGRGTFVVAGKPIALQPGVVVDMRPNVLHSLDATEDLELVVLHCRVSGDPAVAVHCGA